jgi:predicted ATPase/DNA-binding SARP family transcriptional activator
MEVHLLGPLLVRTDRRTLVLASARERAVLTALALRPSGVVSVDALQIALWGEEPPPSARKAIQTYVSSLRRALPPGSITTAPTGYVLDHPPERVDVVRFEALARAARATTDRHEALAGFSEALSLWRGQPLQDLADHPDNDAEVRRLVELHRGIEEDRAQVRLDGGEHGALVGELEAAVANEPLRERRWWQLMLALYRSGRQADALRAFQRLRDLLGDELGIDPSPELVALDQAILDQSPELDLPPAPPTRPPAPAPAMTPPAAVSAAAAVEVLEATAPRQRHNLTTDLTSFVGRHHELAELAELLRSHRLLTLTGPGGCGKTRLARAIATRLATEDRLPDGVWFVDLTALPPDTGDTELVPGAVATALALDLTGDEPADRTVTAALAGRDLLLVLDNCEHVVAGAAAFAERLLAAAPRLSVLATSREVLGVAGERAWAVPSLSLPDPAALAGGLDAAGAERSEAMELFVSRMPVPRALADLDTDERTTMGRIVRRLDGIPLAIELAAARTTVLSLQQLDERLDDRFRVLASGSRTALPRHRTLAAAVEWSHDLLGPIEQAAFRRLAPFAGSFDLEAAEHVVAASDETGLRGPNAETGPDIDIAHVLDLVDSLVAKSLVTVETAGTALRYRLLETLRAFAAGRLAVAGEHDHLHHAHLDWYQTLAGIAAPQLEGPTAPRWLGRLELEHDNLRAALGWALAAGRAADGLALAVDLRTFWDVRGHLAEGRRWLDRAVEEAAGAPAGLRATGVLFAGELAARQGDLEGAARRYRAAADAAEAAGLRWVQGRELHDRAALAGLRGDHDEARRLLDRCLVVAHELDDDRLLARAYGNLGWIAVQQGDAGAASPALDESLTRFRRLGDLQGVAWLLQYRGDLARRAGDLDHARALIEESFDLRIELADTYGLSATLESLAACLDQQHDRTGAAVLRDERLKLLRELGHRHPAGGTRARRIILTGTDDPGERDETREERWRSSTAATTTC